MLHCIHCNSTKPAWLLLKNDNIYVDINKNNIAETIQMCSYLCTQKCKHNFPKNYGNLILNKEDFKYSLIPIRNKDRKEFEFLTYEEIQELDINEKNEYYKQRDDYVSMDASKLEFYDEVEKEEMKIFYIENEEFTSEEEFDDY